MIIIIGNIPCHLFYKIIREMIGLKKLIAIGLAVLVMPMMSHVMWYIDHLRYFEMQVDISSISRDSAPE